MAGGVFISYRRSDSAAFAGRIADFFAYNHKDIRVFFDIVGIAPGDNFVETIRSRLESSEVVLAIIGPTWLEAADGSGDRRIDNPQDFVRMELSMALAMGARVIPVLLDDARMPDASQLPHDLEKLAYCNAEFMRGAAFARDAQHLGEFVSGFLAQSSRVITAPPQAPSRALAAEVKRSLVEAFTTYRDSGRDDDFIILENVDGRFVQFVKDGQGHVIMDLPYQALSASELATARALLSESYNADGDDQGDISYQVRLPLEPAYLSHITMDVFEHVYGALPDDPLGVEINA